MIVRLKDHDSPERTRAVRRFQFYDSPIKSLDGTGIQPRRRWFQFYDSPIKSRVEQRHVAGILEFQFYDSPIKRRSRI